MHRTSRSAALSAALGLVLAACGGQAAPSASEPETSEQPVASQAASSLPTPVLTEEITPFMEAPFAGSFPTANLLDHNVPLEFVDSNGTQLSYWGEPMAFFDGHSGYDWLMPEGTPLLAAFDGTVEIAGVADPFFCPSLGRDVDDQGTIVINTTATNFAQDRFAVYYAHGSRVDVAVGDKVTAGQQIGLSGNTGCSTEPHLHFEVYRDTHTNTGHRATVDPYGWTGSGEDPWLADRRGAESINLWKPGEAPELHLEVRLAVNGGGSTAAFSITTVRWAGTDDVANPNDEFVEVTLDPRYGGDSMALTGYRIENNANLAFSFPAGFTLTAAQPSVRVYSGSGTATATELYWGQASPAWSNLGDCAQLVDPGGGRYLISTPGSPGCL